MQFLPTQYSLSRCRLSLSPIAAALAIGAVLAAQPADAAIPKARADRVTVATYESVPIKVTKNDGGLADGPIKVTLISKPGHGWAWVSGKVVGYRSKKGFQGTDKVVYRITDRDGQSSKANVEINVYAKKGSGGGESVSPPPSAGSTASTPTFSPTGGTHTDSVTVALKTATSAATLYYTTDGTTPNTNSQYYGGPILLTKTTRLKAIAIADGYKKSAVASKLFTIATGSGGSGYEPANPNASANVRAVLRYLNDLTNYEKHVIPGQMIGWPFRDTFGAIAEIHRKWGYWLGIIHFDLTSCGYEAGFNWDKNLPKLIDYWNKGGLISASVHYTDPKHGTCARSQQPYPDITRVIKKGTRENTNFVRELDEIAQRLRVLENAGVVVLFTPLNEPEIRTSTKWWAGRTPTEYKSLYKYIFDYFTYNKHLNNLIWCFNARRTGSGAVKNLYPGANWVDITGHNHGGHYAHPELGQFAKAYAEHMKHNQIFAWTEGMNFGKLKYFDWMRVVQAINKFYPKTTYWVNYDTWMDFSGRLRKSGLENDGRNAENMLGDPIIITRDEINWRSYLQ